MEITSFINIDFKPICPGDTIKKMCSIFEQSTYTHLPVVDENVLLGSISEEDCKSLQTTKTAGDYQYLCHIFYVKKSTTWLDVLEAFAQNQTNLMPVLNETGEYIGFYELSDILSFFNDTPFLNEPGGTLIIEKNWKDYTFSEITQIVESNNGKLLGAFISANKDNIVQITLKIANTGLNEIIQTFRRYNYEIISGSEDDTYLEDLKDRSEYLRKYLNI